jgi:hypothetical protein
LPLRRAGAGSRTSTVGPPSRVGDDNTYPI